jgi:hypothetical protein
MNRTHGQDWVYGFWFLIAMAALLAICSCGAPVGISETRPERDAGRWVDVQEPDWLDEINKRCKEWKRVYFWYDGQLQSAAYCVRF